MSRTLEIVLMTALLLVGSGTLALAVDPDELRERSRPPQLEKKEQPPAAAAEALSSAFKKYSTTRMLLWKVSVSGSVMIMGQFNSEVHCAAARRMLQRQLVRWGWGRAECVEVTLP